MFPPMAALSRFVVLSLAVAASGCAATTAPAPPPEERLVVVNAGENTVALIPVEPIRPTRKVLLGPLEGAAVDVAARGERAIVAGGTSDLVVVVDLRLEQVERTIELPVGSRPIAVTMISETIGYVANAGTNTVTRIDLATGDTASVAVGVFPRDLLLARGFLFIVNGNVEVCGDTLCPIGPSWLTVVDPKNNARAAGRDSIPLPTQGQAISIAIDGFGLLYVLNTGDLDAGIQGRLSIVDPIRREEVGSFGGFGLVPATAISDGAERLFVTSTEDGLMEFNTRTRRVVRGSGSGIFVSDNRAAAIDSRGWIYAVEGSGCEQGLPGRLRIFRTDLTEARSIIVGVCPVAATFVQLPGLAEAEGL